MGSTHPLRTLIIGALPILICCGDPSNIVECAQLRNATEREECRFRFAIAATDDPDALQQVLEQVEDPRSRDLLILRLAIAHPRRAGWLCMQAQTEGARAKCRQVLGRPHLATPESGKKSKPLTVPTP